VLIFGQLFFFGLTFLQQLVASNVACVAKENDIWIYVGKSDGRVRADVGCRPFRSVIIFGSFSLLVVNSGSMRICIRYGTKRCDAFVIVTESGHVSSAANCQSL
jgi:hypothetical protein